MIVPGGGMSPDGTGWVACKPGFFPDVRVLSRLFRRLFIQGLMALHRSGELTFFADLAGLAGPDAFTAYLAPLRKPEWVVYAKPPFGGPEAVLAYLSRYTHRVAISNHRLVSADADIRNVDGTGSPDATSSVGRENLVLSVIDIQMSALQERHPVLNTDGLISLPGHDL